MSVDVQAKAEALAVRYNLSAQPEWQQFLHHFDLSETFALVVLLVADADGAELCGTELEKQLQRQNKKLTRLDVSSPEALRNLPSRLLAIHLAADVGGLWIACVVPEYSAEFPAWREAWQLALARLNPRRNEIRRQFKCSLIFVGAPWLQETMRELAPDIWSVRTLVARIEPQSAAETRATATERPAPDSSEAKSGGDPLFALREAEKLRGVPGKELDLARLLDRAGAGFEGGNDLHSAKNAFTEALELRARHGGLPESRLATLLALARVCLALANAKRAIEYAQSARALARQTNNQSGEADALSYLGLAYADLGEARKAIEFHGQALALIREIGDQQRESRILGNLGNAYVALGDVRMAVGFYEQQLALSRKVGDRLGEANAVGSLGHSYLSLGDKLEAIEFNERSLAIFREIGDRQAEGTILGNLGVVYLNLGDIPRAIAYFEQRLKIAREIGDQRGEVSALSNLGIAYASLGDQRRAINSYEEQLKIARTIGDRYGESKGLWNMAMALNKSGDRTQAVAFGEAALKIFEAIEDPRAEKVRAALAEWHKPVERL
jgi:tetratricopeptide (TPR) repeat protein